MRGIFKYILLLGLVSALGACSGDAVLPEAPDSPVVSGDKFDVTVSVAIPGMTTANTRGVFNNTPGSGLKLTLLEFSKGTDASDSFLTSIYQAAATGQTNVANGGIVNFKVTLNLTSEPRRLHLMIADDFITCYYGSEASILPTITVSGNREAYWGKVDFDNGYSSLNDVGEPVLRDDVKTKLQKVPVIRNFAKVSVSESLDNFELYGFELVNVPASGTIVPWNQSTLTVPELLNGGTMKSYSEIGNSYSGVLPANTYFDNQEPVLKGWDESSIPGGKFTSSDKYLYEHPFESSRHTYLIIDGNYTYRTEGQATNRRGYYKIDLGRQENGTFRYYNLLRNISYNVKITGVSAPGAASISEAIDGVTFNNISADVKTTSMPSVSDGENMLIVNSTSNVFVDSSDTFRLEFQYITDVTGNKTVDNGGLIVQWLDKDRNVITDPTEGDVVAGYSESTEGDHRIITITPKTPSNIAREEYIRITDGKGLERIVSLVLRLPWDFSGSLFQGGILNEPTVSSSENVSTAPGTPFTLYFNLPDGIPESVFPLRFQIEADNQDIENNPVGTLLVSTGPSLFNPSYPAISYIKTVSWQEYNYKYKQGTTGNEVDVSETNRNTNHLVRCRLRTITSGSGDTKIRIYNTYFNMGETSFKRM